MFRDFLRRSLQRRLLVSLVLGVGLSLATFQIVVDQLVDRSIARSFASPSVGASERDQLLREVDLVLLGGVITVLAVSAIIATLAVRRGLQPLEHVAAAAQRISIDRFPQALPLDEVPQEVRPLCERFNQLIERLLEALEHERRFAAGLAHELRTPLAEIRALGEAGVARDQVPALQQFLKQTTAAAVGLQETVESLLAVARAEQGGARDSFEPMSVAAAVRKRMEGLCVSDPEDFARIVVRVCENAWAQCEPRLFDVMLANLLANALRHGDRDGIIEIEWQAAEGTRAGALRVTNHARRLTLADVQTLRDRSIRPARGPRVGAAEGTGLGLWVIGRLCRTLDLVLELHLDEQHRLSASIAGFKGV